MPNRLPVPDDQLTTLLDSFDSRGILHVTFGSVLNHAPFPCAFLRGFVQQQEVYSHARKAFQPTSPFRTAGTGAGTR
jgi:hypothetical protein